MKNIAVLLAGCGVYDGSEIHEATFALLAIDKEGAKYTCLAPDISQMHVVNHRTGDATQEKRNVLEESARIARGDIKSIKEVNVDDFDALILPGGFGAAKNWSTFATESENCAVNPDVEKLVKEFNAKGKPVGAICIAPAVISRILGKEKHITVTIGNDKSTAGTLEKFGAKHVDKKVTDIAIDEKNKIITTPAYMLATRISEVADGVSKLVKAVINMA